MISSRCAGMMAAVVASGAWVGSASGQYAAWLDEIDFDQLVSHYGGTQANGSNVPVTIVESGGYPDVNDDRFSPGKTLTPRTGAAATSGHATIVAAMFFGDSSGFSQRSVAPGIANIDMYTTAWSGAFFLAPGTVGPLVSPNNSRVATHAYGEVQGLNNLARMDWVVRADDYMQVVGSHAISSHGNGFNSIAVAPVAGLSGADLGGTSLVQAGTPYVAGRYRPDIIGPHGTSSDSIGAIGGVAALLASRGMTTQSNHSYTARPGYQVASGHTSEVVKAALMAGASRATSGNSATINITDYRADPANRTANGLDKRFGAGLVNVYQSYRIIDAGETDSFEDGELGLSGAYGFDYDPVFGGAGGSNATATYTFVTIGAGQFAATLAWNLNVTGPTGQFGNFDSSAVLYNLDLKLIDVTGGNAIVAESASTIDNTESLWADLVAGRTYQLVVARGAGQGDFEWDYGLAWRSDAALVVPEPAALGLLSGGIAVLMRRRRH